MTNMLTFISMIGSRLGPPSLPRVAVWPFFPTALAASKQARLVDVLQKFGVGVGGLGLLPSEDPG